MAALTNAEVRAYREDGYVVPAYRVSEEKMTVPTTSWFRRDLEMPFSGYPSNFSDRPIWLARGRDVCARNDFAIGHANPAPHPVAASS